MAKYYECSFTITQQRVWLVNMTNMIKTFADLRQGMLERHTAVNATTNPVAKMLGTLTGTQLEYIIGQYSLFPAKIVAFLYAARDRARATGWHAVADELTRNMGEELGTESDGVTHYEMLLSGIAELSDTELYAKWKGLSASPATGAFLKRIETAISSTNMAYAAGATYALESSAVPELVIVRNLLENFLNAYDAVISGKLQTFFDMHLGTWEPGHEQGLHGAIPEHLAQDEVGSFRTGFEEVMDAMDAWWAGLADEATSKE